MLMTAGRNYTHIFKVVVTVPNGHQWAKRRHPDYCYAQSNTEKESLKELSLTLTLNITLITNILFHRKSVTTVWHCTNHFVYFKFEVVY